MRIPDKLRILALEASNVKAIRAVAIKPDADQAVTITGDNGAGKTSVLDAIAWALGGTKLCPPEPIRVGEDEATIRVELTEDDALPHFVVERTFKRKKDGGTSGALKVMNADGARYPSPQAILDAVVGRLAFDPTDFQRLPPKKQVELLLDMLGLEFEDLDLERTKLYDDRADLNREVKRLGGLLASAPNIPDDLPGEAITMDAMLADLATAQGHENTTREMELKAQQAAQSARQAQADLEAALARVEEAKGALARGEEAKATTEAELERWKAGAEERESVASVEGRMREAEAVNQLIRDREARIKVETELEHTKAAAKTKTEAIEDVDRRKRERLEAAEMPVEGLSVTAEHVTLGGLPLQQVNSAKQLEVSLAIGWALNPTLRVMFIRDGSLLDQKSLALVKAAAVDRDGQLWIERVSAAEEERAVLIVDGEVAGAAPTE